MNAQLKAAEDYFFWFVELLLMLNLNVFLLAATPESIETIACLFQYVSRHCTTLYGRRRGGRWRCVGSIDAGCRNWRRIEGGIVQAAKRWSGNRFVVANRLRFDWLWFGADIGCSNGRWWWGWWGIIGQHRWVLIVDGGGRVGGVMVCSDRWWWWSWNDDNSVGRWLYNWIRSGNILRRPFTLPCYYTKNDFDLHGLSVYIYKVN